MDNNNNGFQDYSSPEPYDPDAQYGFAPNNNMTNAATNTAANDTLEYGASNQNFNNENPQNTWQTQGTGGYNLNGQYYQGSSGSYNGGTGYSNSQYGMPDNGGYHYGGGSYNANAGMIPLDKKGRPLRNRFGMKLAFSILGIFFSCFLLIGEAYFALIPLILSIMALIFACMQNKYYSEGKWDSFRTAARSSTVFLWVDFAVWMILIILFFIGLIAILSIGKSITGDLNTDDGNDPFSGYEYDYDDDDSADRKGDASDTVNDLAGQYVPYVEGFNTFKLQGQKLTLPVSMEAFYNAGFYMSQEDESDQIEPGQSDGYAYYDAEDNYLGTVFVYNTKESSIHAEDGVVGGLTINRGDNVELTMVGNLSFDSSLQEAAKVLGTDVSDYHKGDYYSYYSWYFENGGYGTSIELDFDTENELDEVWIMNYDELDE